MRQILLRVPDDIHRRLTARARREGRSVNALATEILDVASDADQGDRRSRLRAAAQAGGVLRDAPAPAVPAEERDLVLESTRGLGAQADRLLDEQRGPR